MVLRRQLVLTAESAARLSGQPPAVVALQELATCGADLDLLEHVERWRSGQPDPARYVPGDAIALRCFSSTDKVAAAMESLAKQDYDNARLLMAQYMACRYARQFFLPQAALDAVVAADAPRDDLWSRLRLPAPLCCVWFEEDLPVPPDSVVTPDDVKTALAHAQRAMAGARSLSAPPVYDRTRRQKTLAERAVDDGSGIAGVLFVADRTCRPLDYVVWIVSCPPLAEAEPPYNLDRVRGSIDGIASRSTLAPFLRSLVATVAWGAWHEPVAPVAANGRRNEERRAVGTSAWKRKEMAGALAQVRVVDMAATMPKATAKSRAQADAILERLSPIPHWRRPHLRRVRVGPRSEWHYEVREISATRVVPHGPVRSGDVVWRIPEEVVLAEGEAVGAAPGHAGVRP